MISRNVFEWSELLGLVVPFCVWAALMFSPLSAGRKSLANLGEPICIGFAMPVLALLRVIIGLRIPAWVCAAGSIAVLSGVAVGIFFGFRVCPNDHRAHRIMRLGWQFAPRVSGWRPPLQKENAMMQEAHPA